MDRHLKIVHRRAAHIVAELGAVGGPRIGWEPLRRVGQHQFIAGFNRIDAALELCALRLN